MELDLQNFMRAPRAQQYSITEAPQHPLPPFGLINSKPLRQVLTDSFDIKIPQSEDIQERLGRKFNIVHFKKKMK
jgi:hypothetical protein